MTSSSQPLAEAAGSTSASLIERVRRLDADAWQRLCALYGPVVYGWCRRSGLQDSDAADAVQEIFRSVFRGIADFRGRQQDGRGGSFRGWLWTITRNQVRLFFRNQEKRPQALGGSDAQRRLAQQPDAFAALEEPDPDDWSATRQRIVHRALELIRGDFLPTTWEAFSRVTLQGLSIQEVAAALGLTVNAVRQAKFRVLRRLSEELQGQL
jgi:RNA polymerase sigma-70 factor (ECF subfamily)